MIWVCFDSFVGSYGDFVGGHQVDPDEGQHRQHAMKDPNHGSQSFREFRWCGHDSGENHTKDVDGRQAQESLDAE